MRQLKRRRVIAAVAATVAVAGSLLASTAAAAPIESAGTSTITLVTGDKVTVQPGGAINVKPAVGREKMVFSSTRDGQHQYVIPADAQRLISAGKLDQRLFDVKLLASYGYDDGHRQDLPLILRYAKNAAQPKLAGAQTGVQLPRLGMTAVRESKSAAVSFWASASRGAEKIWLDGKRKIDLNESVPQIGAPTAWAAGYTGKSVTTAILDTGIDATHPDFAGKIADSKDFTGGNNTDDRVGHGTHVASIITGSGAASNGKYKGVAPDTKLAIGKVCGDESCSESAMAAGMTWAAETVHARVVNISIGGADGPGIDPLEQAVDDLSTADGTLFVIAAGNDGCDGCIESPGSADAALTVGAVTKKDELADFSSRGPRLDGAIKPDIAAPGVNIVAAKAKNGTIGDPSDSPAYVSLSGTSMATPHVAGAAAIVAGEHPDWTGQQIKSALMNSAKSLDGIALLAQGAGRVDVGKAISQELLTSPASLSVPTQIWPHTDDKPFAQTLSYHNGGKTALTLAVAAQVTGPGGKPAPAGMFTTSASTVTVPAGGDASVSVTTNTKISGPDGIYVGHLVATAGDRTIQTPIAVNREVESYNLTIVATDRSGAPASYPFAEIVNYTSKNGLTEGYDPDGDGVFTVRLPKGTYGLTTIIIAPDSSTASKLDTPVVNLNHDTVITADARKAKPLDIAVDDPAASPIGTTVSGGFHAAAGDFSHDLISPGAGDGVFVGANGSAAPARYRASIASTWGVLTPDRQTVQVLYNLAAERAGSMFTGVRIRPKASDLAHVRIHEFVKAPGHPTYHAAQLKYSDGTPAAATSAIAGDPGTSVSDLYLTPGNWGLTDAVGGYSNGTVLQGSASRVYSRGTYDVDFNRAVFGPGFGAGLNVDMSRATAQYPDYLWLTPQLLSDADPTHTGVALGADQRLSTLYRDGAKVAESADPILIYNAPSADATYKLDSHMTQHFMPVSTTVDASWTFKSKKTANAYGVALPLFSLRFSPKLDTDNSAAAGTFTLPITVNRLDSTSKTAIATPTIEYSTDDGKTWQKAAVTVNGSGGWNAVVTNPGSGYVSLRSTATDSGGNASSGTIIRAYAVKGR
jgi:subtilisin family serine protease